MNRKSCFTGVITLLLTSSLLLPMMLSSCSLFTNKAAEAMVRIYADSAVGQGIIVDESGYVVTSSHYLQDSQSILVELKAGERYEGKILCLDQAKDIAVIRMQGDFPVLLPLVIGDSDLARQYDEVSVMRYPTGSKNIMISKGTITTLPVSSEVNYLQTDAALDAGSAGGALLNKADELIGIISWDASQPGREGYALVSNEVASVIAQAQEAEADPLEIVSMEVPIVTNTNAILTWETNRPSTGQVEFGLQAGTYVFKTTEDTALLTTHSSVVANLQPDITYYFRARSIDCCGNEVVSPDNSFTTMGKGPAGKLNIVNTQVFGISSSGASVRWISNKPASSTVYYWTEKAGNKQAITDTNLVYEHEVRIDGLNAETRYFISVQSDTNGETAQADATTITTPSTAQVCCKVFCRIPDFDFQTMQDSHFTYADLAGKETVIVFSKTGCSYCMQQALFLNDYHVKNPDVARMMIVFSNEKMSDVTEWAKKYGITVPVYLDERGDLVNQCKLRTIPSWLIVDEGTIIKYYHSGGYGSKQEMERSITDNLQ